MTGRIVVFTDPSSGEVLTAVCEGAHTPTILEGLTVRVIWFTSAGCRVHEEIVTVRHGNLEPEVKR